MQKLSMDQLNRISKEEFALLAKTPIVVVLDDVRSMNNVGSIFRTADGFAVEKIILCGYTPQPPHRDIQKTALGSTETVPWEHRATTAEALQHLKNEGYKVYAVEQVTNSMMLHSIQADWNKIAIVLGNEVEGVSEEALSLCDGAIEIPQIGTKHSFNVAVAAGIVLWKLFETRPQ